MASIIIAVVGGPIIGFALGYFIAVVVVCTINADDKIRALRGK